ncbi:MAG: uroporphyrinogen decarboxylase family protein [Phycisphaerae bacterium]|jgi:uroporphyrinogen decarboxylase
MFSPPVKAALEKHYNTVNLNDFLELPVRMISLKNQKPLYADPETFGPTIADEFGVTWSTNELDRGSPIGNCLTKDSLEGYKFPDPHLPRRFEDIGSWCISQQGNYRVIWVGDLWERATFMRGMENILLDVALNQTFVQQLLESLTDYILETLKILFDKFDFEAIALSDDYGTQRGMLISPQQWRQLIRPCLKRIYDFAKSAGRDVFHHSCGNVIEIIPDLIDIGLDILHPIQPEAMNPFELKKRFGSSLTFCGGMSTQTVLPNGTVDEVRRTVKQLKNEMGYSGGYIFEPGITLLADVPLENIIAMIDEVKQ